ncbi:MAG: DNA-nicking Smr family endonuclease [Colwellia sp.]|jgi:DNA-nicking Smr family endonuclease
MKFKEALTSHEIDLFKQAIGKVKPIVQDKIAPIKKHVQSKSLQRAKTKVNAKKKQHAEFYFSDEFEPNLNQQGPMKYVREDVDSFEAKNLRRGQYAPDLILDLHGLDQKTAKLEIAALMYACKKEHAKCVCIVHGLGSKVLKNKVPHWLVQHPDVMAFHQAPLEWGGNGALLVLVELNDRFADIV